jgi:hypothetical protein
LLFRPAFRNVIRKRLLFRPVFRNVIRKRLPFRPVFRNVIRKRLLFRPVFRNVIRKGLPFRTRRAVSVGGVGLARRQCAVLEPLVSHSLCGFASAADGGKAWFELTIQTIVSVAKRGVAWRIATAHCNTGA